MIIPSLTILVGFYILFSRYNFVAYILGLEVILLGTNMNFLFTIAQSTGYVTMVNLVLLLVAAIETVIGLSLIVNLQNTSASIEIPITQIKG
jgi:NADH:ubiquinone oxidoreductase subunit K